MGNSQGVHPDGGEEITFRVTSARYPKLSSLRGYLLHLPDLLIPPFPRLVREQTYSPASLPSSGTVCPGSWLNRVAPGPVGALGLEGAGGLSPLGLLCTRLRNLSQNCIHSLA